MSKEMKDAADLFASEGEEAREILEGLKEQAKDALGVAVSEAPAEGDVLGRFRHFKERELPLIMRLEDPSERRAVLEDISKAHDLKVSNLQKALAAAEERADEAAAQDHEGEDPQDAALVPEPSTERYEKALALLRCPDILLRVAQDMRRLGHVGEPDNKRLAFVCAFILQDSRLERCSYPFRRSLYALGCRETSGAAIDNCCWEAYTGE